MGSIDMTNESGYRIKNQWHSQPRPIRIVCVGAGAAGLLVAYKLKRNLKLFDLAIYEKNAGIGGTWYENRYPGCACDVPAHVYTYSFEPNPDWSAFYASAPEIRQYFERFAEKYDLYPYIRTKTRVLSSTWVEEKGVYELEVQLEDGTIIQDWCHILINGTGTLSRWKWPDIPGLHDFKGKLVHSADWDTSVDWTGKTVAVIGTGSSAIQIVPQVQKTAGKVICFMRSVTWISPPIAGDVLNETKAHSSDPGQSQTNQYFYTEEDKRQFRENPDELLAYRKKLESQFTGTFDIFIAGSQMSKDAQRLMRDEMYRRIGPGHEELKKNLIPTWAPGCRRMTPGEGYLEALVQDNVVTVHKNIAKVVPEGLLDSTRQLHQADIIVCATGFDVSHKPNFTVTGVNGADMRQEFEPEPYVYLSMAVPKFPNYFTINGARGSWASGTALNSHEACVDYIVKCISRIQTENIRALEVKMEPVKQLYEHMDEWHKGSVWNDECKSWYKNNIPGGKPLLWGGSSLHFIKTLQLVRWEHYDFRYFGNNMWEFLGNGRVEAEMTNDIDGLAPYIRNEDTPWSVQ
ncbi:FAD-binding monooxygenase tazF [Exophiala dermatitidis]